MIVSICGELQPGIDWNFCDNDETEDKLAPFPADWDQQWNDFTVKPTITLQSFIVFIFVSEFFFCR